MKNLRETINLTKWQTTQGTRTPTNPATLWRRTESDDTLLTRMATSNVLRRGARSLFRQQRQRVNRQLVTRTPTD